MMICYFICYDFFLFIKTLIRLTLCKPTPLFILKIITELLEIFQTFKDGYFKYFIAIVILMKSKLSFVLVLFYVYLNVATNKPWTSEQLQDLNKDFLSIICDLEAQQFYNNGQTVQCMNCHHIRSYVFIILFITMLQDRNIPSKTKVAVI